MGERSWAPCSSAPPRVGPSGVRLVQISYHNRSLSLYAKLGFDVRETFAAMHGEPQSAADAGVRGPPGDPRRRRRLQRTVRPRPRLRSGGRGRPRRRRRKARVVERLGRVTGYTTGIGYFNHSVAETNDDLKALIGAATRIDAPGMVVPLGNRELFRWCLEAGLRVFFVMNLMAIGIYQEPRGAYLASVGY